MIAQMLASVGVRGVLDAQSRLSSLAASEDVRVALLAATTECWEDAAESAIWGHDRRGVRRCEEEHALRASRRPLLHSRAFGTRHGARGASVLSACHQQPP
jgi:hypothetical protein